MPVTSKHLTPICFTPPPALVTYAIPEGLFQQGFAVLINACADILFPSLTENRDARAEFVATFTNVLSLHTRIGSEHRGAISEGLKHVYMRLVSTGEYQLSAGDKILIVEKLQEAFSSCTPGFHNRVCEINLMLQRPISRDGIRLQVRENIVNRVAYEKSLSQSEGIHMYNLVRSTAAHQGYGVSPLNELDRYLRIYDSDLPSIISALETAFDEQYQPLLLLKDSIDVMRDDLRALGYKGVRTVVTEYVFHALKESEKWPDCNRDEGLKLY